MSSFGENFGKGDSPAKTVVAPAAPQQHEMEERASRRTAPASSVYAGRRISRSRQQRVVTLLLWGLPDQGKSAYLWALGHRLLSARTKGYRFSERLPSFQKHWALLDKQLGSDWARTKATTEISGGELDLFRIRRDGGSRLFSSVEVELCSMDIPGEQIAEEGGYKQDAQSDWRVMANIRNQMNQAQACFIVVRADRMLASDGECKRAADFIRQSFKVIAKEGSTEKRTAVVLTACDAVQDPDWRRRLGFGDQDLGEADRCKAATEFLLERDSLIGEGLAQFSNVGVFATSAFGQAPEEHDGRKSVAVPKPKYVEEPVAWVLDAEFEERENFVWARRRRLALGSFAFVALIAALLAQLFLAPVVRAFDRDAVVGAMAPEMSELPTFVLQAQGARSLSALHALAIDGTRSGRDSASAAALEILRRLDVDRYYFSRAFLEVCRIRVDRWHSEVNTAPRTPTDEAALIASQIVFAGAGLDRYGRSVMRLRELLARVQGITGPSDGATQQIFSVLAQDRLLAVQHGGELVRAVWDRWCLVGLQSSDTKAILARVDEAATLIPRSEWIGLLQGAAPELARLACQDLIVGDSGNLLRLLRWRTTDALASKAIAEGVRSAYEQGVSGPAGDRQGSSLLAREFALCYSQHVWLSSALPDLLYRVVEVLVTRQEESALLRIDPKVITQLNPEPRYALAAVEWAAIHPRTRVEANGSLRELHAECARRMGQAEPEAALALLDRFRFVSEMLGRRFRALRSVGRGLVNESAVALLGRRDVLSQLPPARVRGLIRNLGTDGSAPDSVRILELSRSVFAKADEIPPATLVAVIEQLLLWLESSSVTGDDLEVRSAIEQLAAHLVGRSLGEAPQFNGDSLGRIVTCRFLLPLEESKRELLDQTAADVANNIVRIEEWDGEASNAVARWLVRHPDADRIRRMLDRPAAIRALLIADALAALVRTDHVEFALLARGVTTLSSGAVADALLDDLRNSPMLDAAVLISSANTYRSAIEALPANESLKVELSSVCGEALQALFDEAGSEGLSPAGAAACDHLVASVRAVGGSQEQLPERTRRRLQIEFLRSAFAQLVLGRSEVAASKVEEAYYWGELAEPQVVEAAATMDGDLEDALGDALALRASTPDHASRFAFVREQLIKVLLTRCGRVASDDVLIDRLTRCCEEWQGAGPKVVALSATLDRRALDLASRGEWATLIDLWRVAVRCEAVGLMPARLWSSDNDRLMVALVNSSSLVRRDGWAAASAVAAMSELTGIVGINQSQCEVFARSLVAACLDRIRESSEVTELDGMGRRFFSTLIKILEDAGAASPYGRAVDALADLCCIDLVRNAENSDLELVTATIPEVAENQFDAAFGARVGAITLGSSACAALMRVAGASARPLLFRAAVEGMLARPSPWSLEEAAGYLRGSSRLDGLDAQQIERLIAWLEPVAMTALSELRSLPSASGQIDVIAMLLGEVDRIAGQASAGTGSRKLQERLGLFMARELQEASPALWAAIGVGLQRFSPIASRLGVMQLMATIRSENWSAARQILAENSGGELGGRFARFVAQAPAMIRLAGPGRIAYVSDDEVSVAAYRRFLDAMQDSPNALADLIRSAKLDDNIRLADLSPGPTRKGLDTDDMPVHKVSWNAARLYAEWIGQELPTVNDYQVMWGQGTFPWGDRWQKSSTNTADRYPVGATVQLEAVSHGASESPGLRHLHGNVAEYAADSSSLEEVVVFGASAWMSGQSCTRSSCTQVFAERSARSERRLGVGFRTMLRLPESE